jgi:hypothetical protein
VTVSAGTQGAVPAATCANEYRSRGFVHGRLLDGRKFRSFKGRLRDERVTTHEFVSMNDPSQRLEAWRPDYNPHRPHGPLGRLTQDELPKFGQVNLPRSSWLPAENCPVSGKRHLA